MNSLDLETAIALVDAMSEIGVEAEERKDYSGRGMYGATCVAIVSDDPRAAAALAYCAGLMGLDWDQVPARTDSMGRGVVIY